MIALFCGCNTKFKLLLAWPAVQKNEPTSAGESNNGTTGNDSKQFEEGGQQRNSRSNSILEVPWIRPVALKVAVGSIAAVAIAIRLATVSEVGEGRPRGDGRGRALP